MISYTVPLSNLRRPITVDASAFWFCSLSKWQGLLAEVRDQSSDKVKVKNALNALRKHDAAGRMMETEEGALAERPCDWCLRQNMELQCRVLKTQEGTACAYCRRMAKAGCTANAAPEVDEYADFVKKPELTELEERVAKTELLLRTVTRGSKRRVVESDTEGGDNNDRITMHTLKTFYFDQDEEAFQTKTARKALGVSDVLIKTTHSGLCYTDVHAKSKGCGLGHEGVGIVQEVGQAVIHMHRGDRVGWGWLHSSCGHCTTCVTGYRQYCAEARGFAFSDEDQGAFGDYRIIDSAFAYRIPDSISSIDAGPLMCAGASTFEALDAAGAKASDRIGVFGIGGLGHTAILFARAMGCAVTAISSDQDKLSDAFSMGADECRCVDKLEKVWRIDGEDYQAFEEASQMNINILLITSNEVPELDRMLPLLARRATVVLMTIQQKPLVVPYMSFVLPGHKLIASTEASRENHIRMLDFAGRHRIKPWVQEFPMTAEGVAEAFERLESGNMRYRGVLVRGET